MENLPRKGSPAKIYAFCNPEERIFKIFGKRLLNIWKEIIEDGLYLVDVSISCAGGSFDMPKKPTQKDGETTAAYENRCNNWKRKCDEIYIEWDEIKLEREQQFEDIITHYNAEIFSYIDGQSGYLLFCDSFSARVKLSGKCLRDLAYNFAHVFEIESVEDICIEKSAELPFNSNNDINIIAPNPDAPIIAVIDSGIQEGHKYLEPAIIGNDSLCLVKGTSSVADEVIDGGHGTRVAGAILYPNGIPIFGDYHLPCWIRNARVLDAKNEHSIQNSIFPPLLIRKIVEEYCLKKTVKTKIFNHSISESSSSEIKHMSPWAAEIDMQSYLNDVLFVQATGNISDITIKQFYNDNISYPTYLFEEKSRIANPAQSLQALTVGSISHVTYESEDEISIGNENEPSAFSRSGPGIWDYIKPDVVEYGGTWVKNKEGADIRLTTPPDVCPELLRVAPDGNAYAKDVIGTSFSTPKVAYVAAEIQRILPDSPALLYRALIAQSARWPSVYTQSPDVVLRYIGYGIPDVRRAVENNDYRITLITAKQMELNAGQAHIFKIPIPEELVSVGEDYDVLVEITLSYAAKPRNTRRTIRRYLSTWLDWRCSKIGEKIEAFTERIFETGAAVEDDGNFNWVIGEQSNHGQADDFSRTFSTLQKDWALIKSNQLTDDFCIAVRGHRGWDESSPAKYSLVVSFEAINQDIEIYDRIRTLVEIEIDNIEQEIEVKDFHAENNAEN